MPPKAREAPKGLSFDVEPATGHKSPEVDFSRSGIEAACTAFVVVLITPRDKYVRRVYLSLHSAQAALLRAVDRGQPAELVLCR